MSRTVQMGTTPSGNSVGNTSVTTSEELDRQGRLWKVTEAAGTSSAVTAEYSYDAGSRLSKVCSGASAGTCAQSRFFNYDKRGLLASEQHPEKGAAGNGVVSYTYDARGHVLTKAEGGTASNFRLGYAYDRAERLIDVRETNRANRLVKQYTFAAANGVDVAGATDYRKGRLESAVRYNYDRPAIAFDGVVTERYEYAGPGGRPSRKVTEVRNGATMVGSFDHRLTYTAHGLPENLTYPDCTAPASCASSDPARTVTSSYANGLLTGVNGYATLTYDANGMVTNVAHANGLHTRSPVPPNRMTRPEAITVQDGPSGGVYWTTGTHVYDGAGNVKQIGYDYYVYDRLGRVVEGSAEYASAANNKIQRYGYDAYGNMTSMATLVNGVTTNTRTMGIQTSTNRLCAAPYPCSSGNVGAVAYDEAGNLTTRSTATSTFDSQNIMATLSDGAAVSYVYTAGDERIWAYTSTPSQSSRWWLRGLDGKVLREYATTGASTAQTWTFGRDYVYRGGPLLAAVANGGAVTHFHLDHLGSTRLITNAAKGVMEKTSYFPFGEESSAAGPETKKFTGHERDYNSASGAHLDYMHARYYSPYWGRFLSVDPKLTIDRNLSEPQRWNRYSYVTNNPLKYVDQDGRDATVAWRIAWVFAPSAARWVGRTVVTGVRETAIQRLSGFQYARPVVVPTVTQPILSEGPNKTIDEILSHTQPGRDTKGRSTQHVAEGGIDQAVRDFNDLVAPGSVQDLGGGVLVGSTPDGKMVAVYPNSTDGRATVDIQDGKKHTKIRYNEPKEDDDDDGRPPEQ